MIDPDMKTTGTKTDASYADRSLDGFYRMGC